MIALSSLVTAATATASPCKKFDISNISVITEDIYLNLRLIVN